jgi:hypothetical protein
MRSTFASTKTDESKSTDACNYPALLVIHAVIYAMISGNGIGGTLNALFVDLPSFQMTPQK